MTIQAPIACIVTSITFSKVINDITYTINQDVIADTIAVVQTPDCSAALGHSFDIHKAGVL